MPTAAATPQQTSPGNAEQVNDKLPELDDLPTWLRDESPSPRGQGVDQQPDRLTILAGGPQATNRLRSPWVLIAALASGAAAAAIGQQLQQEHDVGRDTVLRAIEILREEGLLFTVARRGTYVSPDSK